MPPREIHCEFTRRKYGVTGEPFHKWIDELWKKLGPRHRQYRHYYNDWIPQRFIDMYGLDLARKIIRSHIWLDDNWDWYKYKFYQ